MIFAPFDLNMVKKNIPISQPSYAQMLAREIFQKRRTLKEVESELKSSHRGWRVYYAVVRALNRMR